MYVRQAVALAVALLAWLATRQAFAWQEAHQTGEDVRMRVDSHGVASLELDLRWNVVRGPLKFIDLAGVDPAAIVEPHVTIAAEDGRELTAQALRRDDRTVRLVFDEPRSLMRGRFTFQLRWHIDLAASGALVRDGPSFRMVWSTPVAADGFDSLRTSIDLPSAPDAPRPIAPDTGAVDESVVATLRRDAARDVLDLVRPHVTRGESVPWTLRVHARAFALASDPRFRPASEAAPAGEPNRVNEVSLAAGLFGLALSFAFLVAHKGRTFAKACAARGGRAEGLVAVPVAIRAPLAGAALAAAVGLQIASMPMAGAVCLALATLTVALRSAPATAAPRGPGRWFALRPMDAFVPPLVPSATRGHWLDVGSTAGRLSALAFATTVALCALLSAHWDSAGPWLVAMDSAPLAPLFVTGLRSQLPPDGTCAGPWLAEAFRGLRTSKAVRVAPWARVLPDGGSIDELRLLVLPRVAMPGVIGLEVGLAWIATPAGWAPLPEVLARVLEGSAAAAMVARLAPGLRALPGRRPEERVVRLLPNAPTRSSTVALARAMAEALTDRRAALAGEEWTAAERRIARTRAGFGLVDARA